MTQTIDIDYSRHPAFAPFISSNRSADETVNTFRDTDAAIQAHVREGDRSRQEVIRVLDGLRRAVADHAAIESAMKPFVIAAFERAMERSLDEETRRRDWDAGLAKAPARTRRAAECISNDGYAIFRMPPKALARLKSVLLPDIEDLRRRAAAQPDEIVVMAPSNPEATDIVNQFCRSVGLFDTFSAYYNESFYGVGFAIHLSHPKDTWFRTFDDIDLAMPKTTQMHFDLEYSVPKAMLYLDDVGEKQGPFSLQPKASTWDRFGMELAFWKEILYSVADYTKAQYGKSTTGNTPIFRHPEARRAFASLPPSLRGTSHPGDHVLDGTPLSGQLLAGETRLVGEAGTMPVFTGGHVLHRGGLVEQGERLALQIIFAKGTPPPRPKLSNRLYQLYVKSGARKVVKAVGLR